MAFIQIDVCCGRRMSKKNRKKMSKIRDDHVSIVNNQKRIDHGQIYYFTETITVIHPEAACDTVCIFLLPESECSAWHDGG